MSEHENDGVKTVCKALSEKGFSDTLVDLPDGTKTVDQAAKALGVAPGAIVVTKVYTVGNRYVLALMAGDSECQSDQLGRIFNLDGAVVHPSPDLVRAVTGFAVGGPTGTVPPVGLVAKLPVAIDASLKRFDKLFASAGSGSQVFPTTYKSLKDMTDGLVSYALAGSGAHAKIVT